MSETIISKRCSHCKEIKTISEFSKCKASKDGLQNCCKYCKKVLQRNYRQTSNGKTRVKNYNQSQKRKANLKRYQQSEKGKDTNKHYRQSKMGKAVHNRAISKYRKRHPEKFAAQKAVNSAIKLGKLPRADTLQCHYCPEPAKQYHHHKGYAPEYWFDVVPACRKCHIIHN